MSEARRTRLLDEHLPEVLGSLEAMEYLQESSLSWARPGGYTASSCGFPGDMAVEEFPE